jgi:SAM-dependent methyltransferase
MKRCLACQHSFASQTWRCPFCDNEPALRNDILCFAENPAAEEGGFKSEYFAKLASLEEGHFWFRSRNRLIQWALQKYFPQAESFFEIGCGTGFVLKGIRESSPTLCLSGSEIFNDGLAFAQNRLPGVKLYQMDARHIPFDREFDVVAAFDVLEHVVEDETVLEEMLRALRPGGGILITVPQHRFLWSTVDEHSMHQRRYSRSELRTKVERAGFRIGRITSFISLLLPFMLASRMKRNRNHDFHLWREFEINPLLNAAFESVLAFENSLIKAGFSFPVGGSLLLAASKPGTMS